jgi:hypothetical protein
VTRDRIGRAAIAWFAAWVVTAFLIGATAYESRDPDSRLYAGISQHLAGEPAVQWIAPEWWGLWNTYGPYFEHPVGLFVPAAALGRTGYPPGQAAYALNALYQVASFALVTSISAFVVPVRDARALGWILQLLPIAFVFRIRANQEYAVLAALLFAVYATERARKSPIWIAGMLAGFCAVLLVKGVFAGMVPVVCAVWLVARAEPDGFLRGPQRRAWAGIVLMPVAGLAVAWGYDALYFHVTGRSFLELYSGRQLPDGSLTGGSRLVRTSYTAAWYVSRVIWYAFPWSLVAISAAVVGIRRGGWRPGWMSGNGIPEWTRGQQAAWFGILSGFLLTAAFSLASRKADRYIFPVYFIVAAVGAGVALRRVPSLSRLADRLDRPWVPAAVYVGLILLTLLSTGRLPQFTFWRT